MKIENSVALVTGANRGIGRAFVEELLAAGAARIYAAARKPESLARLVKAGNGRVIAVGLDVTDAAEAASAARNRDVTLVINNAGVAHLAGVTSEPDNDKARQEMETNYFGVLNVVRAFAPVLAGNGGGAIINIASIASHVNFPSLATYSASKAAAHSLTQALRAELAGQGTQVVGVYPGPVDTDMAADIQMAKVTPGSVARAALVALQADEEDVFPDPMSAAMRAGLLADPKAVERQAAGTPLE